MFRLKKTFIFIFIISLLTLTVTTINPVLGVGNKHSLSIKEVETNLVQKISVYEGTLKNQLLYNLVVDHINMNMDKDLTINEFKKLKDFSNNVYSLFELEPTGYIVYHNESGKFVEYSSLNPSMYLGLA